jgi:hypothetical protein
LLGLLGVAHDPSDDRAGRLDGMNDAGYYPHADIHHPGIGALCGLRQLLAQRDLLRAKRLIPASGRRRHYATRGQRSHQEMQRAAPIIDTGGHGIVGGRHHNGGLLPGLTASRIVQHLLG